MKPPLLHLHHSNLSFPTTLLSPPHHPNPKPLTSFKPNLLKFAHFSSKSPIRSKRSDSVVIGAPIVDQSGSENRFNVVEIGNPNVPPFVSLRSSVFGSSDRAFFLFTFIAFTTTAALVGFVAAAVPTLRAMGRAANSLAKLADTAIEELPSTMAAIRLSGMEISDLTLELSDLSQDISEGVNKSAQAVQAAEVGIRQIGALARKQTASLIQERASLPVISFQPVVSGAAKKTSRAVSLATRTVMSIISGGEFTSKAKEDDSANRSDI